MMSELDHLLAAIERCEKRAKIAKGNLDRFTLMRAGTAPTAAWRGSSVAYLKWQANKALSI